MITKEDKAAAEFEELEKKVNSIHIPNADEILASMDKPKVCVASEHLILENLKCVDDKGKPFERYDKLYVSKDIVREEKIDSNGNKQIVPVNFTPYQAAAYFEKKGMFLPSYALSCNIVAALFEAGLEKQRDGGYKVLDADINKVLMQYKSHTENYSGIHRQNTFIDWKKRKIIHYPSDSDFTSAGGNDKINQGRRKELDFKVKDFGDMGLEKALKSPDYEKFIKNLSGLKNPEILVEIGKYFGKPVRIWVPSNPEKCKDTRAAWFGCDGNDFNIATYSNLDINYAACGVFLASEASLSGGEAALGGMGNTKIGGNTSK